MVIDLASGLFLYVVVSFAFGQNFDWLSLFVAIFFAFFPDNVDYPAYEALRKKFKLASHRFFHYPLVVLPVVFTVCYWWQGYYGAILCFSATVAHFVHDSFNPTGKRSGIKWLAPFNWDLYYIENMTIHTISWQEWEVYLKQAVKGVEKRSLIEEVMMRMEPAGTKTKIFLVASVVLLIIYYFTSQ